MALTARVTIDTGGVLEAVSDMLTTVYAHDPHSAEGEAFIEELEGYIAEWRVEHNKRAARRLLGVR